MNPAVAGERWGPWFWSPARDLGVFGGSALLALVLVLVRHALGIGSELPEWGFLLFVLAVDVAHVYATLFRTYFDAAELRAHPLRYGLIPLAGYALGVAAYRTSSGLFWTALAYLALFHFVRQAVGWVAVYRARAGLITKGERALDEAVVYASTLYPVLVWHRDLGAKSFHWFVPGDFLPVPLAASLVTPAGALWALALAAFFARELKRLLRGEHVVVGRVIVVATTALTWYVGIVLTNSDFDFTVTNVIVHGVPYIALLWAYARAQAAEKRPNFAATVAGTGGAAFVLVLLFCAFAEELAWDRLVWHDRPWLFGDGTSLRSDVLAWIVPLLALPQLTHYVLDAFLWRRRETRRLPAQRAALGFALNSTT